MASFSVFRRDVKVVNCRYELRKEIYFTDGRHFISKRGKQKVINVLFSSKTILLYYEIVLEKDMYIFTLSPETSVAVNLVICGGYHEMTL